MGVQGIGNWCRDWIVQDFQSLHALHGAVYLQAPLPSRVEILAFISISSDSAYIPPLWLTGGLILSISLRLGSSQPLEV